MGTCMYHNIVMKLLLGKCEGFMTPILAVHSQGQVLSVTMRLFSLSGP